MKQLLNTLYVMTQGAYLSLDHETVRVEVGGDLKMQAPLHHIGTVVAMGNVLISPFLLGKCAEEGLAVVILDRSGRYKCRMVGKTTGNVLLRQAQYKAVQDGAVATALAAAVTAGKVKNARNVLMRCAREVQSADEEALLRKSADRHAQALRTLKEPRDVDHVRGLEGEAAAAYFAVFPLMIKPSERDGLPMKGRTRRPPLDPVNALLSFLYTLLLNDCISALEGVGLDPQMGFLHVPRPGRPSLGLDLMEEFRAFLADRLAITLINRRQVTKEDFEPRPGGAVYLSEKGRKEVITAWQKRKLDELDHPLLEEKTPVGLLPHLQARLLARHLRGDLEAYLPYIHP
ncbi:MAG: type I-C CRISPR-associated endonuclease Cas1c [Syntrophobacteraceae bacterium]